MILLRSRIKEAMVNGKIVIDPLADGAINPNSVNLRLDPELLIYDTVKGVTDYHTKYNGSLDAKSDNEYRTIIMEDTGHVLYPGILYLGRTFERTETHGFVPMLEGRSSLGRLGVAIHVTAGFGDIGFKGYWTLELFVVQPVKIYPMMEVAQIYFHECSGDKTDTYKGKYQDNTGIQTCQLYKEIKEVPPSHRCPHCNSMIHRFLPFDNNVVKICANCFSLWDIEKGEPVKTSDGHVGLYQGYYANHHWIKPEGMTNLPYEYFELSRS